MGLKQKTVVGVLWNSLETFGGQFIQVIITIILARILVPSDFGVIGMLAIFMELSKVILDSGFSQALIRQKDTTEQDFTSVFYFNVAIGVVIYALLFTLAPVIARFYNYPELSNIARVSFLAILINSFGVVQNAKITKELNFRVLAKRTIIANLIAGILAVILAFMGAGVWALIFQILFASFIRGILLWRFSKWHPSFNFSITPIKKMLGFSANLMLSGVLDAFVSNIQTLLIGKFYTRTDLGYYSQANRLESMPATTLTAIVRNVTYPILSSIQDNIEQLKQAYRKIIGIAVFLVFPLMLWLLAIGDNLIIVLLGEKWIPSIEYFRLMCIVGAILPLYSINLNIFLVRGNSKMFLKINIIKRIITLAAILSTLTISVFYIVAGQVTATIINTIITMIYSGKEINYSFKHQVLDIIWIIFISILMASVVFYLAYFIQIENRIIILLLQASIGLAFYISLAYIFKLRAFYDIKEIILLQIKKSK